MAEEAGEILLRKGFPLPGLKEASLKEDSLAQYDPKTKTVLLNVKEKVISYIRSEGGYWARGEHQYDKGKKSQKNLLLHEVSHFLDHIGIEENIQKIRDERSNPKLNPYMSAAVTKAEAASVSAYAAENPAEYRAELIAGILSGKVYPQKLLDAAFLDVLGKEDVRFKAVHDMGSGAVPNTSMVEKQFGRMMEALFHEDGASLRIELLDHPEVAKFTESHAQVMDNAFMQVEMSETMRNRLKESDYIFSGIKTFHELNEAFPSLLDENGNRKSFNQFLNDVQEIDSTYNKAYLSAEYNHAQAAAEMAAKWEEFEEDGDEYNLQYRTAGDDKVRPEHAALHGVTLPMSDPFWDEYYPPNGWNCRCTVVQVLKDKYPATDRGEALRRGQEALAKDTKGIFHFNPGKQAKTFPDYNAYTLSRCNTCTRKLELAKGVAENELCQACLFVRTCSDARSFYPDSEQGHRLMISSRADIKDLEQNIITARKVLAAFPDSTMEIRRHYKDGRKNPEYTIDGIIADRKGIEGYKGITTGFRSSLGQGCKAVIFDLDQHMGKKPLPTRKLARKLYGRKDDFITGRMERCYIVHRGKAILITKDDYAHGGKDDSLEWLEGLLW